MTAVTIVLGLDLGSTTSKAALVDVADGARTVWLARAETPDDPRALLGTVARLVRDAVAHASTPIAAVGIASMAETGVALDRDGAPLLPLVRWDRADGRDALAALLRRHPDLPERTGIPATPKPALVMLHGLRAGEPEAFGRIARWQGVADFVAGALTGSHATDHTLAARSMLLDPSSHIDRRWDADLLTDLGLTADVLPRVLAAGEPAGTTSSAAAAFGLAAGLPVHIAGHDHAVGAWGAGVRRPGEVVDSLGTAEAVMTVTERAPSAAVHDGFSIGRTVDDRHDTVMGGSPACGGLLAQWPGTPADVLAALPVDVWRTSPVTVLPYPRGRQCPHPDPAARVVMSGRASSPSDVARGLLQSLVLHSRWMREAMAAHTGASTERVVLLGSLVDRIPVWGPLAAAATDATVLRCTAAEPVAAAAALLAAVRTGLAAETSALDTVAVPACDATDLDDAYRRLIDAALQPRHPDPSEGEK